MIDTNHAMEPGSSAYGPAIQKKVPKYFTPAGAFERRMASPMTVMMCPAKMNGERSLSLSEKHAKAIVRRAGGEVV